MQVLSCPLCHGEVASGSSGCRTCHLPMKDVARHQAARRSAPAAAGRAVLERLLGVLLYGGAIAWSWFYAPSTMKFVLPAAAIGAVLHVVRGRPWLGFAAFTLVVVVAPVFLLPALGMGTVTDVVEGNG